MRNRRISFLTIMFFILVLNFNICTCIVKECYLPQTITSDFNIENPFLNNNIKTAYQSEGNGAISPFIHNFANLTGHGWRVREVAFSPTDLILATGSSDGSIRLWNLTNGDVLHIFSRHHYGVISLDFSPSGEILASGGYDNCINLWNVSSGEWIKAFSFYPHAVIDIKWAPDGKTLAVAGGEWMGVVNNWYQPENYLKLLNATNGETIKWYVGHTKPVFSISFSKDGTSLISGSWDLSVRLWNVTTGSEIRSFTGHTKKITSVTFAHNESIIISGSLDQTLKYWNISTGNILQNIDIDQSIWSIDLSPIDDTLAVAVDPSIIWPNQYWLTFGELHDCTVQLWNITSRNLIDTLPGHKNTIESVKFSPDGNILASASWDWTCKLWGEHSSISIDEQIDEWAVSSLEEQKIDSKLLAEKFKNLKSYDLHSVLIARHGKLVFEEYYDDDLSNNYSPYLKHTLFSATKSFTSILIGIAIDKGFINSTEQLVLDLFPEATIDNYDKRKEDITIHDLLTMTSGLTFDEYDDIWGMGIADDSVEYVLSRPMYNDPGSKYCYNTGSSQILSGIIQKTTGYSTRDFAMKFLFDPLGIEESDVAWVAGHDGVNCGGIGLFLTPRNMLKFGQLLLNNGFWNREQIISSDWIKLSSQNHIEGLPISGGVYPPGYGYHFWVDGDDLYYALGYGGQTIQILPRYDIVIVTTARQEESIFTDIPYLVLDCLLPEQQKIPGYKISLIFFCILLFALVFHLKHRRLFYLVSEDK
ncbi:MAG: serine hydrolase [Candidatus Lokiarchaeota archaeon]|nr:serine hydrolase [Candidatus Lokiarchaeota archaeon]